MRITSGIHRGRTLHTPKGKYIRPTSDKVRAAIFNALISRGAVQNSSVLDLFCGTGAMGLEALSQGASSCVFVDKARTSLDLAKANAQQLDEIKRSTFVLSEAEKMKSRTLDDQSFDLVFIDPPYEKNLVLPSITNLIETDLLNTQAFIVIECERSFSMMPPSDFDVVFEKVYGETKVISFIAPE